MINCQVSIDFESTFTVKYFNKSLLPLGLPVVNLGQVLFYQNRHNIESLRTDSRKPNKITQDDIVAIAGKSRFNLAFCGQKSMVLYQTIKLLCTSTRLLLESLRKFSYEVFFFVEIIPKLPIIERTSFP